MGKGLAIVGVLGAVFATFLMLILVGAAAFLALPVVIAGSIVLVAQRTVAGAIAGLLVLALAVVAALGLAGSVTTESGTTDFGFSETAGRILAIAACLALPLAAIIVAWPDVDPPALSYVGLFCIAVAFLMAVTRPGSLVNQSDFMAVAAGLLPLGGVAPMVGLFRSASSGPAAEPPAP